jgi:hypothetical protein
LDAVTSVGVQVPAGRNCNAEVHCDGSAGRAARGKERDVEPDVKVTVTVSDDRHQDGLTVTCAENVKGVAVVPIPDGGSTAALWIVPQLAAARTRC